MSRIFTWWRRFHGGVKIPKKYLYKGASEFLQRIEFGEYEFNNLGREVHLEDAIHDAEIKRITKESPWLKEDSLEEAIRDSRKQMNKRKDKIMSAHLKAEHLLLREIRTKLAEEFDLDPTFVEKEMEEFDGTTRELYFHIKSIALDRTFSADKQPRLIQEQPRHILKPKERKYAKLWSKLIKENKWQDFLNWDQLKQ
jgi:hypothetical protein|tara:strand:- start:2917 stop:3507 length:591 start_codon:yes stop_codon:yes gene_type:complete